jgi:Mn-dependent DtxR family transcriptional regulator
LEERKMEITEKVIKVLKESVQPLKSGEIAEKVGVDKKEVDKAIKKLKKSGDIISPKRCYYSVNK